MKRFPAFLRAARIAALIFCGWNVRCHLVRGWRMAAALVRWKWTGINAPNWPQRLRFGCGRCPIYYRPNKTCGKPGKTWINPVTGVEEQQGCLCYMLFKVLLQEAECWLAEATEGEQDGWSEC